MSSVKKGLALIIANADYQSQPQLPSCHKDGTDMKAKLEQLNFDVLYYTNTTRKTILEAISEFIKLADCYSVLLVYYTGHGVQIDGENYFVPIDCIYHPVKSVFIASSLVGVNTITQYMNEHEEKTNILILDACRSSLSFAKEMGNIGLAEISAVSSLKETPLAFQIDPYYLDLLTRCRDFLSSSGGSSLPPNMAKVELYYTLPIFLPLSSITISHKQQDFTFDLKLIGSGSYANVYKYKDTFYNRPFILKRAKKELTDKEVARFKREFDVMNGLSSPYILEVYCYNPDKNEYIMEYMDYTLDGYIAAHNSTLTIIQRKGIAQQILRAFDYLHSKGHLHRDISPKNILIKEYDDTLVVKLSDFGLVKIPDSTLTTVNTEFKGYFNDPALVVEGFNTYGIVHETYALTRVIYFVMTGKTNTEKIANQNLRAFVERGLNPDKTKRFQNIRDMISAFKTI